MNEIVSRTNNQITHYPDDRDPFESLANEVAPRELIGLPLRYKKGDFILGDENVELDTTFVAVMPLLLRGYVRWQDSKPTEKIFARTSFGERAPDRLALGDNDRTLWEGDKDPWAETMMCPLVRVSDGAACTFQTSSYGGRRALGELARAYWKGRKKYPAEHLPLVKLQSRTRQSQDYGSIKEPLFPVVAWEPIALHRDAFDAAGILELLAEQPPPLSPARDEFAANARSRQAMTSEMDDEIPF